MAGPLAPPPPTKTLCEHPSTSRVHAARSERSWIWVVPLPQRAAEQADAFVHSTAFSSGQGLLMGCLLLQSIDNVCGMFSMFAGYVPLFGRGDTSDPPSAPARDWSPPSSQLVLSHGMYTHHGTSHSIRHAFRPLCCPRTHPMHACKTRIHMRNAAHLARLRALFAAGCCEKTGVL